MPGEVDGQRDLGLTISDPWKRRQDIWNAAAAMSPRGIRSLVVWSDKLRKCWTAATKMDPPITDELWTIACAYLPHDQAANRDKRSPEYKDWKANVEWMLRPSQWPGFVNSAVDWHNEQKHLAASAAVEAKRQAEQQRQAEEQRKTADQIRNDPSNAAKAAAFNAKFRAAVEKTILPGQRR